MATMFSFSVKAQNIIALTSSNELMQITNPATPNATSPLVTIIGIASGQTIVGIDYRPNTGELYALGYNSSLSSANSQLYVLNANTGNATAVGSVSSLNLGSGSISFDFNPTVDRIRVMGENGMNYRLHPVTGALAAIDGNLAYAATDVNSSSTSAIAACAYTNSYIGTETTTLFDYDKNLNILASQIPPNNGTLNTIGTSGLIASGGSNLGMDIYFDPITKMNIAFLNATVGGSNNLYTLNTSTGVATLLGAIGTGSTDIREIAVQIDRTIPATYPGQLVYGLTRINRNLISFTTDNPELIRTLTPISGVTAGQIIVGMDIRPVDGGLYALGYNELSSTYQLYTIDKTTGVATSIGSSGTINLGVGEKIGFDFNPTVDRIRVVSTNDNNFRLHPTTGLIVANDVSLAYAAADVNTGDNPYVSTVAYINSYAGTTTTTLYGIDDSNAVFCSIVPPNNGVLNTLATLPAFNLADLTNDLDFFYDSTTLQNLGFMSANLSGSMNDQLFMITTAGSITLINNIGLGVQVSDIAVQLTYTGSLVNGMTTTQTQCGGSYTWASNNMTYTQSGTYYTGSSGSTDTLVLTINSLPMVMASDVNGCPGSAISLIGSPIGGTFSLANPYTGPSTTYAYTFTDANGCTATSSPATITVLGASAINNINVTDISGNTALINWDGVAGLGWYEVRYRVFGNSSWNVGTQQAPTLSKQLIGLSASSNYEVQVRGFCAINSPGPWSATIVFTTGAGCQAPIGLMTTNITANAATLTWTANSTSAWYNTRYRVIGSPTWIIGTAGGSSTTKLINGLSANTDYEWQIRTHCNPAPNSNVSDWSAFETFSTASLKANESVLSDNVFVDAISIYPNPTSSILNVEISSEASQKTVVKLFDISGRLMKQIYVNSEAGVSTIKIDMSEMAAGLYTAQVFANDKLSYIRKISKQVTN